MLPDGNNGRRIACTLRSIQIGYATRSPRGVRSRGTSRHSRSGARHREKSRALGRGHRGRGPAPDSGSSCLKALAARVPLVLPVNRRFLIVRRRPGDPSHPFFLKGVGVGVWRGQRQCQRCKPQRRCTAAIAVTILYHDANILLQAGSRPTGPSKIKGLFGSWALARQIYGGIASGANQSRMLRQNNNQWTLDKLIELWPAIGPDLVEYRKPIICYAG
jgi:hypothetical protein